MVFLPYSWVRKYKFRQDLINTRVGVKPYVSLNQLFISKLHPNTNISGSFKVKTKRWQPHLETPVGHLYRGALEGLRCGWTRGRVSGTYDGLWQCLECWDRDERGGGQTLHGCARSDGSLWRRGQWSEGRHRSRSLQHLNSTTVSTSFSSVRFLLDLKNNRLQLARML